MLIPAKTSSSLPLYVPLLSYSVACSHFTAQREQLSANLSYHMQRIWVFTGKYWLNEYQRSIGTYIRRYRRVLHFIVEELPDFQHSNLRVTKEAVSFLMKKF